MLIGRFVAIPIIGAIERWVLTTPLNTQVGRKWVGIKAFAIATAILRTTSIGSKSFGPTKRWPGAVTALALICYIIAARVVCTVTVIMTAIGNRLVEACTILITPVARTDIRVIALHIISTAIVGWNNCTCMIILATSFIATIGIGAIRIICATPKAPDVMALMNIQRPAVLTKRFITWMICIFRTVIASPATVCVILRVTAGSINTRIVRARVRVFAIIVVVAACVNITVRARMVFARRVDTNSTKFTITGVIAFEWLEFT